MKIASITVALLLCGAASVMAQDKAALFPAPGDVKWGPAPPTLPKGAEAAVLAGDPMKPGPFVIRLKLPANYEIPAHHHSTTENVTVLSGSFHAGMGDKLDKKASQGFGPGGFASLPAQMNHFAWAASPTVVQIEAQGPFDIVYVNPEDDPTKK
jgi:anti-sigma factor ChrR (cupin superfamily)